MISIPDYLKPKMPQEDIMTDTNTNDADVVVNNTQTPVVNTEAKTTNTPVANTPASNIQTYMSGIESNMTALAAALNHTEKIVGELNGFVPMENGNGVSVKSEMSISDRLSVLDSDLTNIFTRVIEINNSLDNSLLK